MVTGGIITRQRPAEFNLPQLFELAFGYKGLPFLQPPIETDVTTAEGFDPNQQIQNTKQPTFTDGLNRSTPLGTPLFMPISINGIQLPNEPILQVDIKKNIVETPLTGSSRKGTVKELINTTDYNINIRGIVIDFNNMYKYPSEQVEQLKELFLLNESLPVNNELLTNILGVERLVIKDFRLPEMVGIQHAQAYEFLCTSDEDFILELE